MSSSTRCHADFVIMCKDPQDGKDTIDIHDEDDTCSNCQCLSKEKSDLLIRIAGQNQ